MKLYFVECRDSELANHLIDLDPTQVLEVFRGSGYTNNHKMLSSIRYMSDTIVLSNDETLLNRNDIFYKANAEATAGEWEVYLWQYPGWKNINECADRELRFAHNLRNIYLAGGFEK